MVNLARLVVVIATVGVAVPTFAQLTSYAVQVSATTQAAPAQIQLSWAPETIAQVNTYSVMRREGAGGWTTLANLTGTTNTFTDTSVSTGRVYEYQVVKRATTLTGYGYVASAIELPTPDNRGIVLLVVERGAAAALPGEVDRLARDLAGDGWTVRRHDVGRDDSPNSVRTLIQGAYAADPANTRAVLLLGRVPIARSGNLNVDGHGGRGLPTDAFYGDVDGAWPDSSGDGTLDPSTLPSDVELMVGRVDFADMGVAGDEISLLRRYLQKDHDWRHGRIRVTSRALVGDRLGDFSGEAFAASGVRLFPALLGPSKTEAVAVVDGTAPANRWISRLTSGDYLWAYGAGAGSNTTIAGLGTSGQFSDVRSVDMLGARGMFYLLFGSWFVDWSQPDNIMRAALAAPGFGLTAAWSGRPHLFLHHMAVGEPIGFGIRLSQNNSGLYANAINSHQRGVHIALLGDPTLRLQVVAPPGALTIPSSAGSPTLQWAASAEASHGYHVYRSPSDWGPWTRVTASPVTGTTFNDNTAPVGDHTYMVRAIRAEVSGSATYFNASQGVFARATVSVPPSAPPPAPETSPAPENPPPPPVPPAPSPSPIGAPNSGGGGGGGGAPSWWLISALLVLAAVRAAQRPGAR